MLFLPLKRKAKPELHLPHRVCRADLSESRVGARIRSWIRKIHQVERIGHLGAKHQSPALGKVEFPEDAQIHVLQAGAVEDTSPRGAVKTVNRLRDAREGSRIKPLVHYLASGTIWIQKRNPDQLGAIVVGAVKIAVAARRDRQGPSAAQGGD